LPKTFFGSLLILEYTKPQRIISSEYPCEEAGLNQTIYRLMLSGFVVKIDLRSK